jgi:protein-S-isoprenylcysteine O-methyltransferase Ste14
MRWNWGIGLWSGGILFQLGAPRFLGSLWRLIPAELTALLVVRTTLEDRPLPNEREGYREYAQ